MSLKVGKSERWRIPGSGILDRIVRIPIAIGTESPKDGAFQVCYILDRIVRIPIAIGTESPKDGAFQVCHILDIAIISISTDNHLPAFRTCRVPALNDLPDFRTSGLN